MPRGLLGAAVLFWGWQTGALPVALVMAAVFLTRPEMRPISRPPSPAAPAVATAPRGYELISDDELLATVHDRALLAVTKADGRREIVVLPNE